MRRDAIFFQLFQRYPAIFFLLIDQQPEAAQRYRFTSVEIKEPSFRIDGVLLPPEDISDRRIFFTEVQFQKDQGIYHRFFAELFLYLYRNQGSYDSWHGTLIFPSRQLIPDDDRNHKMLLDSDQVHCLYLDELEEFDTLPLGLALIKLTVVSEAELIPLSAQLIQKAKQQSKPFPPLPDIIEIVTTVAVYKLTALSREEIEAMLDLEIKETRVYQEIKEEGREEGREEGQMAMAILIAKDLLKTTMSLENVATLTRLELSKVIALQQESDSNASDSNADDIETGDSDKVET